MGSWLLLLQWACVDAQRTVVPFQYAWRFHYGDDPTVPEQLWPAGPGTCAFEEDLQDFPLCEGMEFAVNRFSAKDCRTACCYDPNCMAWQVQGMATAKPWSGDPACFHGYGPNISCARSQKKSGLAGGRRSQRPTPAFRQDYNFAGDVGDVADSSWEVVDTPHDFIAERGNFSNDPSNFKQGYLPRNASWYRKHFRLPAEWKGGHIFVHFEGIFHRAEVYLNGEFVLVHDSGYTGFVVRLDNSSNIRYGDGKGNVLAVRADASYGSGHWYEGGGIYRPVHLVHTAPTHFVHDGLYVSPMVESASSPVAVSVELEGVAGASTVEVRLLNADNEELASNSSTVMVPADSSVQSSLLLRPSALQLWSIKSPTLYRVSAVLMSVDGKVLDNTTTTVGFRSVSWGVDPSFQLNGDSFKLRGFSHHNSIGGLGVAISERVYLFRVQASRAMGANFWRNSHNPYPRSLYDLLDITGTLCWDETRDYGAKYQSGIYVQGMQEMVKRDRNHPSIVVWSVCNERECNQTDAEFSAKAFTEATRALDPDRAISANMIPGYGELWEGRRHLDIDGFSHKDVAAFETFHKEFPNKPSLSSECGVCSHSRLERDGSSECQAKMNAPGLLPYVAGSSGVWTMMDYFGEPAGAGTTGWPKVSSNFGMFDIAGFPKADTYWYPVNWLQGFPEQSAGRPLAAAAAVARILDLPDRLTEPKLSAVVSAPWAELVVDGVSLGKQATPWDEAGQLGTLSWTLKSLSFKVATVTALDANGAVLASHSLRAPAKSGKRKLRLTMDVPSETTGTGKALVLDGRDTALLRASVVEPQASPSSSLGLFLAADAEEFALVSTATDRITWTVISGPGRVVGVSNGDEASHEWMKSTSANAYGGLVRGFVQVTRDCTSENLALAVSIDEDSGRSRVQVANGCEATEIVVEASADGLESARMIIPVSTDSADAPLSVAATTVRDDFQFSYLLDFLG